VLACTFKVLYSELLDVAAIAIPIVWWTNTQGKPL